jgi:hypothetical protein
MKLGKVYFDCAYVVDLNNSEMVQHAKDALYEDLMGAYKNDELHHWIKTKPAPKAKEKDIPEFLKPEPDNSQTELFDEDSSS